MPARERVLLYTLALALVLSLTLALTSAQKPDVPNGSVTSTGQSGGTEPDGSAESKSEYESEPDPGSEPDTEPEPEPEPAPEPEPEPELESKPDQSQTIQEAVNAIAEKYGAVGVQVAVVRGGTLTESYNYGWATRGTEPMTSEHKIRVASISKVVVGIAAFLLQERGVVSLDADISNYLGAAAKNPYYPDTPVTIRTLLSHTSSIRVFGDDESRKYANVMERLSGSSGYSQVKPGSMDAWGYNNYGFAVLGMLLERASGQYLDEVLNTGLWNALGVDTAFEGGELKNTALLATLYRHGGEVARSVSAQSGLTRPSSPGANGVFFAGGLTASASDIAKLAATLARDGVYDGVRLLSADSVALMETAVFKTSGGFYQALPLRYRENIYGRDCLYYHTGSAYGVYNCMSYDPVTGDAVVVLTTGASATTDSYGIYAVCGEIMQYIYGVIG